MNKKTLKIVVFLIAFGALAVGTLVYAGYNIISKSIDETWKTKKSDDSAKIYIVTRDGVCWSSRNGIDYTGNALMKTGYGNLWFHDGYIVFLPDKETSRNRISKILQLDVKYCVRVDK